MAFTGSAYTELLKYEKTVAFKLELRTNFSASTAWLEFRYVAGTLSIEHPDNKPGTLSCDLVWSATIANERSETNRAQLFAEARVTAYVGTETEVKFQGRVDSCAPVDLGFQLQATSWDVLLEECDCSVALAPSTTPVVADDAYRLVTPVDPDVLGPYIFGFVDDESGTDPAFDEATQLVRRPWAPRSILLSVDEPGADPPIVKGGVPSTHWGVDWDAGALTLLEDTTGRTYYLSNVDANLESAATGATNVDITVLLKAALKCTKASGGIGAVDGEIDFPASLGLDLAQSKRYEGRVGDLLRDVQRDMAPHLRLWWEPATQKWTLALLEQKTAGNENATLVHPKSIALVRSTRDLYSRVVATGSIMYPRNILAQPQSGPDKEVEITVGAELAGGVLWGSRQGGKDDAAGTWADKSPFIWDGDGNTCLTAFDLPGNDPVHWYELMRIDMLTAQNVEYVNAVMVSSKNKWAAQGNNQTELRAGFWPGLKLMIRELDTDPWQLLTPALDGRYAPSSQIEVPKSKIAFGYGRYIQVLCQAAKITVEDTHGLGIGISELVINTRVAYRLVYEIDGNATPATYYTFTRDWDGDGDLDQWQRNHADLWTRLGGRHRTKYIDLGSKYPETLAGDVALGELDESVRLFDGVSYEAVCDPRIRRGWTVIVADAINNTTVSILVESFTLKDMGAEISGANYLAEALDNG